MKILGLNAYHADAAACLVVDGKLVAAAEEERFRRIKHWAGLPSNAVAYCLREGRLGLGDITHIAVNRQPGANFLKKALYAVSKRPRFSAVQDRLRNAAKVRDIRQDLEEAFGCSAHSIQADVHHIEHHCAHLASAFLVSPFESAAVLSVDGFGDFVSAMTGVGEGSKLTVLDRVTFPHSLGLFYLALTQYLGFPDYGDEYKVMGLAAYGEPEYLDGMRRIVRLTSKGGFQLNLDYFLHHSEGVSMVWETGAPVIGRLFSDELVKLFGPPRRPGEPVTHRHENLAASLQMMYEEAFLHLVCHLHDRTRHNTLCLAGGCAQNSVVNGQILSRTPFQQIYLPPATGDSGGAIGAAYIVWSEVLGHSRTFIMDRADWGPEFTEAEIQAELEGRQDPLRQGGFHFERCVQTDLCRRTAKDIAAGKVVGWFQGRMEWGARALGQRSIVADPRRHEMRNILGARVKTREPFRPFAPSILEEATGDYFEQMHASPFMAVTYVVRADKRALIPASTHVNGTGRLQTVNRHTQPLYWQLIKEFQHLTDVPVLLNTSFNENEPIVCTPAEAIDCFLRTGMDTLAIGPFL
ncbi:MAG TPA: carbamoyltransferase C-terminal domain-containing protein, partial [Nitrospiraceae bacterium]|nr:carbamoyltransferase C-terminal domain-containing protein [Nitrospiraceae bacterium]